MNLDALQERLPREITFQSRVQLWENAIDVSAMHTAGGTPMKLKPDRFKAYLDFRLAHAFPVISSYNTAFHPSTLKNSYESMLHQQFNYGHLVKHYYKDSKDDVREDRILGAIVAVEFPREPIGGWRLTDVENAPGMHCVATIAKQAKGMDRVLGQYQTGRQDWTVSLEVDYILAESGVVLIPQNQGELGGASREKALTEDDRAFLAKHTPADYAKAGYHYLPLDQAPDDLIDCFSLDKGQWTKQWRGCKLVTLMGGIGDGKVEFKGTGLVNYGAEPTARIESLLAENKEFSAFSDGLKKLGTILDRYL